MVYRGNIEGLIEVLSVFHRAHERPPSYEMAIRKSSGPYRRACIHPRAGRAPAGRNVLSALQLVGSAAQREFRNSLLKNPSSRASTG